MKYNEYLQNLFHRAGIQRINKPAKHYMPTTVLYEAEGRSITVSDMLEWIEYIVRFIKNHFNVDQQKYKETLIFLRICKLKLQNQSPGKLRKSMAHIAVEVFKEILNMHANNEVIKKENEGIALILDLLIEISEKY